MGGRAIGDARRWTLRPTPGSIVIHATAMAGPQRVAIAEALSGRILLTFASEEDRDFWIEKHTILER
jgi:hypothetical protein